MAMGPAYSPGVCIRIQAQIRPRENRMCFWVLCALAGQIGRCGMESSPGGEATLARNLKTCGAGRQENYGDRR